MPTIPSYEYLQVQHAADQRRINELEAFAQKFLDNFEDCNLCDNGIDATGDTCQKCQGTSKQIDSRGILFVELPDEARALLAKGKAS